MAGAVAGEGVAGGFGGVAGREDAGEGGGGQEGVGFGGGGDGLGWSLFEGFLFAFEVGGHAVGAPFCACAEGTRGGGHVEDC